MGHHRAPRGNRRATSAPASPRRTQSVADVSTTSYSGAGKRKAAKHASARGPLVPLLPSVPVVAGVTALAISAGGAVAASGGGLDNVSRDLAPAAALGQSDATAKLLAERRAVVSRDSKRDAMAEKANDELVQAAEAQAEERNVALAQFANEAEAQAAKIKANQWVLPVQGYRLTAFFGASSGLWSRNHTGLDFAAPSGTTIVSVANGTVTETGYDGSYGNKTVITLEDGTEVWYCHQTSINVTVGQQVRGGEAIGTVGSTGNSTGPHLHLEVRPGAGDPIDPHSSLIAHGLNP